MHWKVRSEWLIVMLQVTVLATVGRAAAAADAKIWHIKAVHPEGRLLDVKAIDQQGGSHDVKAIEQAGNRHILDIKAFVGGQAFAVKVLASGDWFGPVKAVSQDGTVLDIKALTPENDRLDVKAVSRTGHILDIKAIGLERQFYGVKAISGLCFALGDERPIGAGV